VRQLSKTGKVILNTPVNTRWSKFLEPTEQPDIESEATSPIVFGMDEENDQTGYNSSSDAVKEATTPTSKTSWFEFLDNSNWSDGSLQHSVQEEEFEADLEGESKLDVEPFQNISQKTSNVIDVEIKWEFESSSLLIPLDQMSDPSSFVSYRNNYF